MNDTERFFAKVEPDGNGCLVWTGQNNGSGYGVFKNRPAHRWLLERVYGRNEDLVTDHLCLNKMCVRPAHLEFVTIGENTRRAHLGKTKPLAKACKRGHLLTEETIYWYWDTRGKRRRMCKVCQRLNAEATKSPSGRAFNALVARCYRANLRLLEQEPRIAILYGPYGPRPFVMITSGDDLDEINEERGQAILVYRKNVEEVGTRG